MIHVLKDEAHRILGGRVDTDERDEAMVPVPTAGQCLSTEPLQIIFQ